MNNLDIQSLETMLGDPNKKKHLGFGSIPDMKQRLEQPMVDFEIEIHDSKLVERLAIAKHYKALALANSRVQNSVRGQNGETPSETHSVEE